MESADKGVTGLQSFADIEITGSYQIGMLSGAVLADRKMVPPERFELPTNRFEADYSIQLSYGGVGRSEPANWRAAIVPALAGKKPSDFIAC